jgi:hypothetical protein
MMHLDRANNDGMNGALPLQERLLLQQRMRSC